jgi:hypothetical protein
LWALLVNKALRFSPCLLLGIQFDSMAKEYAIVQTPFGGGQAQVDCPQKIEGIEKMSLAGILAKLSEHQFEVSHMNTAQAEGSVVTITVLLQREPINHEESGTD